MRRLRFGTEQVDKDRFDILYSGICVSNRGIGRTELVTFNHLLEKLESVGKPIEEPVRMPDGSTPVRFTLSDAGGTVGLEEPEFMLLNEFHNQVRWSPTAAKTALETYNWIENLPEEKLSLA